MKKLVIILIKLYQKFISPMKGRRTCRFYPSCSQYFISAVSKYGIIKGGLMGIKRILRCNPFNPGGYDPLK
ncbi:membrane protein insertion efficiency factor YidD [Dethiothermospora halolimnae]|uniref:membrane protein insertion efficiency factor YidD n=1 Tax=Dethiothermospora halolimnae TaxID=3114390 RepID=UPI003CCC0134